MASPDSGIYHPARQRPSSVPSLTVVTRIVPLVRSPAGRRPPSAPSIRLHFGPTDHEEPHEDEPGNEAPHVREERDTAHPMLCRGERAHPQEQVGREKFEGNDPRWELQEN